MKNTIIHDTCILFLITLISGLVLGGVYQITKNPIQEQKVKAEKAAYQKVFSDATGFISIGEEELIQGNQLLQENGYTSVVEAASRAEKDSELLGYVMKITTPEGYGGDITISMGLRKDGTVTGVEMLSISETAGLGMKAKEPAFRNQYNDKQVEEFEVTKIGESGEQMIDAISGATITSKAVTDAVNTGIAFYKQMLVEE